MTSLFFSFVLETPLMKLQFGEIELLVNFQEMLHSNDYRLPPHKPI